jgi:antitoxin component YwqK of YwqJK toxin-antitoxin module
MKGLIFIAIAGFLLAGCGDDIKLERRTITYPNGKSVKEDWTFWRKPNGDSLAHGVHKKFFWNGNVSESVIWKLGKRDGSAQAWYDNGAAKWQKSYEDGKKTGTWRLFYQDGHPWLVTHYDNDQLNGTVQMWGKEGAEEPKEAKYVNGACQSGECSLLAEPIIPAEMPAAEKVETTRSWEIIKDFLD